MSELTRHLLVVGHVQGVGFRFAAERQATALGIRGWVRNRSDGTVEAVIQGAPDAVAEMIAWARNGPRHARVERVEVQPAEGTFERFEVRPTE